MAIWNRLTAFITGGAVATAAADALAPEYEVLKQTAWSNEPHKVLSPSEAAQLRVREELPGVPGIDLQGVDLANDAARSGTGRNRFDLLTELVRAHPGSGELIRLRRRGIASKDTEGITEAEFRDQLRRSGYKAETVTAILDLLAEPLDPAQTAAAIHRGLIPDLDPPLLKGEQPSGKRNVESYPVYPISALHEAESAGYDRDKLGVLVGLQGLPMGVIEAALAYYRGIITHGDYIAAFNESNNRNEWANAVLAYAAQIPTARDFIENALRGYRTLKDAQDGAALHGMSPEHARLIFQNSGRPLNLHQITQAKAWGASYNPLPGDDPDPYMNSVLIGSVTPAYYEMQDSLKYNLPSAFFFRVLQTQGVLTEAEAVTWYKRLGWPDELAKKVAGAFAKPTGTTVDPWVKKAETQLWGTLHTAYKNGDANDKDAHDTLQVLGLDEAAIAAVVGLWANERTLDRGRLTPAQLKKAWSKAVKNPLTGQPWTRDEVLAEFLDRGWNQQDANTFLDTPSGP